MRTGDELTVGERAADAAVHGIGSWTYLAIQTVFIPLWMLLNVVALVHHWDPYPWILLNLIFSVQASYAGPLMLLSQRRSDQKASERAEYDLTTDLASLTLLKQIESQVADLTRIIKEDKS